MPQAPLREVYSTPQDPIAIFKGPTSKGRRQQREWEGEEGEGKGVPYYQFSLLATLTEAEYHNVQYSQDICICGYVTTVTLKQIVHCLRILRHLQWHFLLRFIPSSITSNRTYTSNVSFFPPSSSPTERLPAPHSQPVCWILSYITTNPCIIVIIIFFSPLVLHSQGIRN